jgi:hypothetical protein
MRVYLDYTEMEGRCQRRYARWFYRVEFGIGCTLKYFISFEKERCACQYA